MAAAPLTMHGPVDSLGREVPAVSKRIEPGRRQVEVGSAGEVIRLGREGRGQPRGPVSIASSDR
jgi:hypothetical protein